VSARGSPGGLVDTVRGVALWREIAPRFSFTEDRELDSILEIHPTEGGGRWHVLFRRLDRTVALDVDLLGWFLPQVEEGIFEALSFELDADWR
jgi:hypothetical protein